MGTSTFNPKFLLFVIIALLIISAFSNVYLKHSLSVQDEEIRVYVNIIDEQNKIAHNCIFKYNYLIDWINNEHNADLNYSEFHHLTRDLILDKHIKYLEG